MIARGVVGGDRLSLDGHGDFGVSPGLGGFDGAVGEGVADCAAAVGHFLGDAHHAGAVAPVERGVDVAALGGFHVHRDHVADLDCVHPEVVALVDHLGDDGGVVVAAVCAEGPGGLVFEGLHFESGVGAFGDFDLLFAGDGAGVAGGFGDEEVVADGLAGDGVCAVELGFLGVFGAQSADRVDGVHEHVGAEGGEAAGAVLERAVVVDRGGRGDGAFHDQLEVLALGLAEFFAVFGAVASGAVALDDDALEVFGAGDGAGAAAPGGAVVFVHEGGEEHAVFAGLADGHDGGVGFVALVGAEVLDGVVDAEPPDVGGVADFDLVVLDVEVDGLVGLAGDQQGVEAGPAEAGGAPAAHVRVGHGAGERRLGDEGEAPAHGHFGAG